MAVVLYIHARYTLGLDLAGRYDGEKPGVLRFELMDSEWGLVRPVLVGREIPYSVLGDGGNLERHRFRVRDDGYFI